jgi:hypothetical protein
MKFVFFTFILFFTVPVIGQKIFLTPKIFDTIHVKVFPTIYKGKKGIRVLGTDFKSAEMAIIRNLQFTNGVIEGDVSGKPIPGKDSTFRGFIGIALRVDQKDTMRYECFYIRPTNARAQDQVRRNRTTQYMSAPYYPWQKLRSETPGMYESYVDIVPEEWTHLKVVIQGSKAMLFVNRSNQPCLVVNDLKNAEKVGAVALWIGPGTEAYFANFVIKNNNF